MIDQEASFHVLYSISLTRAESLKYSIAAFWNTIKKVASKRFMYTNVEGSGVSVICDGGNFSCNVPSAERVKISSTNLRLKTTVQQKEETFQVIIHVIKNSTFFKAFTISAEVPEIFMQQFWYTIKKVQGIDSYEFLLANKKCRVDAEVFQKILDICPRVEGEEFTEVQDDDATLTFLIDLGYKAIINKCLSGKTASNDRLRKSRIDIMWGMFYKENVDYPELIWEDFTFQIDHRRERKSRRENMPFPRFIKVIIIHFLSQHKSLSNLNYQHYNTIKDDGIISRLKFVRIREDNQDYGLPIPDVMLNDAIKPSESYQMFIKYSTGQIPPKKRRDKGSQGKKTADVSQETIDVSEESEPEPAKKKTGSRSTRDVVIQDTPNTMQALKESKKPSRRQPSTGGSSEGTGRIPGVPDDSTVVSITSCEGTGNKLGVPDEEKVISEVNVILEWRLENESEHSDDSQLYFDDE
ncbi:hypothetical protein Tco_0915057 [Tanacetum coccineum]